MKTIELHCSVSVVKAGEKGNTAAAGAAYISCERNQGYDGKINDYTKKPGLVNSGLMLPDEAPERWRADPSTIWAEQDFLDYEKSTRRGPNSELYRAGRIGLPWEMSYERAAEVAEEILEPLREKGMVVQWAIHDVEEDGVRNFHLHWMASMREASKDGFGKKNRAWNKYNGGLNIPELLRPRVAAILNRELEAVDSEWRYEHESFAKRNVDKIPQRHMGPAATALERKGVETVNGKRNSYIEFLNKIHAENLRGVETMKQVGRVEDLIAGATKRSQGEEVFKDWDALFATVRDARRCRAAMVTELGKVNRVAAAFEEGNESYLRWAGCDPESESQKVKIKEMQSVLHVNIRKMELTENLLLDSKELYKAHNKVVYTAKSAAWDQYQIDKNKRGMAYCARRLQNIESYMSYLMHSVSFFDILFNTQEYKEYRETMADLQRQQEKLKAQYERQYAELKKAEKDIKTHQKEAKAAKRAENKLRREHNIEI